MVEQLGTPRRPAPTVHQVQHLEDWCGRLETFEASPHGYLRAAAARQRGATRAKLDRLAAGRPVTVEGCLVNRPTAGACLLTAGGDVQPLEATS